MQTHATARAGGDGVDSLDVRVCMLKAEGDEPEVVAATLAAATQRIDDGVVAIGLVKVDNIVGTAALRAPYQHADSVAQSVLVASSTTVVSSLSAVEQEEQRRANERASHAPISIEEPSPVVANARPKRSRAPCFEPERWVKAKFSKGGKPAEWFFGQLKQRKLDGRWQVAYQNGEVDDTPESSLHLVDLPPITAAPATAPAVAAGERQALAERSRRVQWQEAVVGNEDSAERDAGAAPPPSTSTSEFTSAEEVEVKSEATDYRTSKYGNRKLFTRKQISEVLGGNFMHAPWCKTNRTGKGPRRPENEKPLLKAHETYVCETPGQAWAPHQPKAAMEPGALRHWNANGLREQIENGEAMHQSGALEIISSGALFEFFAGRQPALYEYCGKYEMKPFDPECEFENPANFSEARVRHLLQQIDSHGRLNPDDPSYQARMKWIKDPENWKLRTITPVSYNEELYRRLSCL